ncbi:MAG: tyrosine-protein kinase family protein [Acidobacteria bacterium]|nr:MAG: tyrosine-protein kinase family protein [Acidobacteriota bacterium]
MSKNFELLTQLGERFSLLTVPDAAAACHEPAENPVVELPVVREKLEAAPTGEELDLVQRVFLLPGPEAPNTVVFCGVDDDEESSSLCLRVGEILASHTSGEVCVVDANLQNPSLHKQYGPASDCGITELVLADGNARRVARKIGNKPMWLLSAGLLNAEGQAMLTLDRLQSQVSELREKFSHVLVSAPPANASREATLFGRFADGVVLVLKANSTRRATALKVKESLEAANVRLLGAVLADRVFPIPEALYRKL